MSGEGTARSRVALLALAVAAAVANAFAPAYRAHFVNWDDPSNLEDLRTFGGELWHFWHSPGQIDPYQPVSWWTLMLDRACWGLRAGLEAPQAGLFHATSVALHALAALAFFGLARRLFAFAMPSAGESARTFASALAAVLFAVHPLRVESVAWISERRDVTSGLFYVFAAWAWLRGVPGERPARAARGAMLACAALAIAAAAAFFVSVEFTAERVLRATSFGRAGLVAGALLWLASLYFGARATARRGARAAWYAIAALAFFLALFSKGLTVVLPVVLLVADVWPLKRADRRAWPALFAEKLPMFAAAAVAGALASWAQLHAGDTLADWSEHTASERIAQSFYGLAFYPSRTAWPHALLPLYELPDELRWSELRFALSAAAVAIAAIAAFVLRKRWPAVLATLAAFALAIAPVLGLAQAGPQLVADRYSYLSCMPFALLAGGAWGSWMSRARNRWLPAGVALAAAIALGWATRRQTATWHDSESLWTRAHALEPGNALAAMNLGVVRAEQAEEAPDPARSIALCDEALALYDGARATSDDPRILLNASHAWTQIANLDAQRREAGRARALEDARLALAAAGEQGMFTPEYRFQYGTALVNAGRLEDGIEHLEWYAKARPGNVRGLLNLGVAWIRAGRPERALPVVERACRLAPSEPFAWELLANACEALGRAKDEAAAWKHVLALAPAHARAQERLAALGAGH